MEEGSGRSLARLSWRPYDVTRRSLLCHRLIQRPASLLALNRYSSYSKDVLRTLHSKSHISSTFLKCRTRLSLQNKDSRLSAKVIRFWSNFRLVPVVCADSVASEVIPVSSQNESSESIESWVGEAYNPPEVTEEEVDEYIANETPRQRIDDLLFKKIEYHMHPRKAFVVRTVCAISISMFLVMGLVERGEARQKFVEKYRGRSYISKYNAARALSHAGMVGFFKRGLSMGFKAFVFTSLFIGTPVLLATYRNERRFTDYLATGVATGALLKVSMGLRGMIAGAVVCGALGASQGAFMYGATAAGLYPSQENFHKRYIYTYLTVERQFEPPPDYRKEEEDEEVEKEPVSFDEQGLIPLNARGRRIRKSIRQALGLSKSTDKTFEDVPTKWVQSDSGWVNVLVESSESTESSDSTGVSVKTGSTESSESTEGSVKSGSTGSTGSPEATGS